MSKKIDYLSVTIRPESYMSSPFRFLRVDILVDGIKRSYQREIHPEDFVSFFDLYIDEAKRNILEQVNENSL